MRNRPSGSTLARTAIAVQLARSYFKSHGVTSSVEIGSLGLSGVSGRFALGEGPELSAERVELHFDPLRWTPTVVEVRLVNPVVRAAVAGFRLEHKAGEARWGLAEFADLPVEVGVRVLARVIEELTGQGLAPRRGKRVALWARMCAEHEGVATLGGVRFAWKSGGVAARTE